jgi:hypothetical protein
METAKNIATGTTGQMSGTERLIGGGRGCQTRAWGNREPVFERAAQTKTAQPLAGLCGSKAELTGNSRLHPLAPLNSGESDQAPTDQRHRNGLRHSTDVKRSGIRAGNGSAADDPSLNTSGTHVAIQH